VRAGRLVALLLHVQRHGGRATAPDLARSLEVSVRTIYRDIASLQEAGVPLWTEPGVHGGVRLMDGWRAPIDGFSTTETQALLVGSTAAADLGLAGVLVAAQSKVVTALPPELRQRAARVRERFLVDAPGWLGRPEPPAHLPTIAEAVWEGRQLDVRYQVGDRRPFRRRVDPLGLVLKAGTWYLVAAHDGTPRTYRLSRVVDAEGRPEPASRPDGFDLAAYWHHSAQEFDLVIRPLHAKVRVGPAGARLLPAVVPGAATSAALEQAGPPSPEGITTLTLPLESVEVAVHQLASICDLEVLEPAELRHALHAHARALARRNAGTVQGSRPARFDGGTGEPR
jgi:predicted DNA-binding transcriptional regulator YafY